MTYIETVGGNIGTQGADVVEARSKFLGVAEQAIARYPSISLWKRGARNVFVTDLTATLAIIDQLNEGNWDEVRDKGAFDRVGQLLKKAGVILPQSETGDPDLICYFKSRVRAAGGRTEVVAAACYDAVAIAATGKTIDTRRREIELEEEALKRRGFNNPEAGSLGRSTHGYQSALRAHIKVRKI